MATFSVTPQASPLGAKLVEIASLNNTVCANVTGASGTLFMVEIDNTANAERIYVKIYDDAAPVVGETDEDLIFYVNPSERVQFAMPTPLIFTALSMAAVKEKATTGVTSPDSAVIVRALTS